MKKIIIALAATIFSLSAHAQFAEWRFEIQPMHFGCAETNKYNDTADRLLVRCTGAMKEGNMELFCQLSNSVTGRAVRPGKNYYVPAQILTLLVANGKDIGEINAVLSAFDVVAIREAN